MMRVILIGGGKTTYFLARQFAGKGYQITIINQNPDDAQKLARELKATVLLGNGCDPWMQAEAQARRTEILVALLPHDEDNLIACQIASKMFGVPRTIALIHDPENEAVFRELGVSVAISSAQIIARIIEEEAGFEDIINLMPLAHGRLNVTEITLSSSSPALGKSLQELALPENSLVASIIRGDEVIIPRGSSRLMRYDHLLLITEPENHGEVIRHLTGDKL
jgi:trk system potassium uptake protein